MEYNLVIESDVDVVLNPKETCKLSFKPKLNALPLGSETDCLPMMTLVHLQKIIVSEIKFFHKQSIDPTTITVYYSNHMLCEGKVLESLCRIDALV